VSEWVSEFWSSYLCFWQEGVFLKQIACMGCGFLLGLDILLKRAACGGRVGYPR